MKALNLILAVLLAVSAILMVALVIGMSADLRDHLERDDAVSICASTAFRHADASLSAIIDQCEDAADNRMALRLEEARVR